MADVDLSLILRNTATASRDAQAALAAVSTLSHRLTGIESRLSAFEGRFSALEGRYAVTEEALVGLAQSNQAIEGMLAEILSRLPVK